MMALLTRWFVRLAPDPVVRALPEDKVQASIDRGRRAENLLADEVLSQAFEEIERKLTEQWRNTSDASSDAREALFRQVAALQSVRGQLKHWSEDAKLYAARIEKARRS